MAKSDVAEAPGHVPGEGWTVTLGQGGDSFEWHCLQGGGFHTFPK